MQTSYCSDNKYRYCDVLPGTFTIHIVDPYCSDRLHGRGGLFGYSKLKNRLPGTMGMRFEIIFFRVRKNAGFCFSDMKYCSTSIKRSTYIYHGASRYSSVLYLVSGVPLIPWTICDWIGYRIFDRPEIVHIDTYRSPSRQRIRGYRYVSEADDRSVQ